MTRSHVPFYTVTYHINTKNEPRLLGHTLETYYINKQDVQALGRPILPPPPFPTTLYSKGEKEANILGFSAIFFWVFTFKFCLHPLTALLGHQVQKSFKFLAIYSKKSSGNPYLKIFVTLLNIFLWIPLGKKIVSQHFWDPEQKLFFALFKKISLQTLVEIFLDFWDPLGPSYNQKKEKKIENFTYGVYQNMVKKGAWSLYLKEFFG